MTPSLGIANGKVAAKCEGTNWGCDRESQTHLRLGCYITTGKGSEVRVNTEGVICWFFLINVFLLKRK